ncbi:TonB family protein [Sphingomonas sp. KRR8]|uniref:energy transducer TonB n=1 Tax=Sphingomonas sp. KRR8 TaxID=2942996 RepID=UPI002020B229|nr:energy transducer TonB [Sphingomonas sp. KRR8]URD62093.1 TonB family protein [Sphingomonas sp. KRR8]
MSYANRRQMSGNKTVAIVIVGLLHVLIGYALITGLAYNVIKKAAEDLKTFDVEDQPPPPPEEPPPPEQKQVETPPPPVVSPPPLVRSNVQTPIIQTAPVAPPPVITPTARPAPPAPPAPPPPPPPRISQAAQARGSLPGLFSTDDYPQDAIRNEQQGTTSVHLTIGTDGRVSGCDVTGSSGSSSLDQATCRIIRSRARYTPAKDQNGAPIAGTDNARIRWVLPSE